MIHIHYGIDADTGRIRGLLDLFSFPRIWFCRDLHDFESNISRQFEAVPIAELLRQHVKDESLLNGKRRRWLEPRIACRGRVRSAERAGTKPCRTHSCRGGF